MRTLLVGELVQQARLADTHVACEQLARRGTGPMNQPTGQCPWSPSPPRTDDNVFENVVVVEVVCHGAGASEALARYMESQAVVLAPWALPGMT